MFNVIKHMYTVLRNKEKSKFITCFVKNSAEIFFLSDLFLHLLGKSEKPCIMENKDDIRTPSQNDVKIGRVVNMSGF
jgi:hypothetical protein